MATVEEQRAMRVTLIAEAATAYFNMLALRNELAIVRRTMDNRAEGVAKARLRFEGGLTSELVYQQAQVEYATTAALVPNLESRIKTTENMLAVLMGHIQGAHTYRPVGFDRSNTFRRTSVRAAFTAFASSSRSAGG